MRKVMAVMAVVVVTGTAAMAGNLKGMQLWVQKSGTGVVDRTLKVNGITNAEERARMTANWDEETVVETALRMKAYGLLDLVAGNDALAAGSLKKIKAAVLAEQTVPPAIWGLATRYPADEREDFRKALEALAAGRYATTPEYGRLAVKYLIKGVSMGGTGMSEEDMVRWLVAGEPMDLATAQRLKEMIKERAVVLARLKLRAEGKSFVTKDGVNPIVAKLAPVIDALNRAECAGLEEALRGLGCKCANADRIDLRKASGVWQEELMRGERLGAVVPTVVGKLSVALGADGYKRFVDVYNNGTGSAQ